MLFYNLYNFSENRSNPIDFIFSWKDNIFEKNYEGNKFTQKTHLLRERNLLGETDLLRERNLLRRNFLSILL